MLGFIKEIKQFVDPENEIETSSYSGMCHR